MLTKLAKSVAGLGIRDTIKILFRHHISVPLFGVDHIFNKRINHEIIEYFDGYQLQNADSSTGFLGFGLLHYSLVANTRPKRILCIGSKKGFVPAMCAMACRDIGFGQVDFVDAGYSESDGKQQWGGIGLWRSQNPLHHFSFLNLAPYINVHVMTTREFFRKNTSRYQYIYVDGDHTYAGVKEDYVSAWKHLDKNGYMSFHDVTVRKMPGQPSYGVWKLWKELSGNKILFNHAGGLGIIQKTEHA